MHGRIRGGTDAAAARLTAVSLIRSDEPEVHGQFPLQRLAYCATRATAFAHRRRPGAQVEAVGGEQRQRQAVDAERDAAGVGDLAGLGRAGPRSLPK